ncbi:hypothetical protein EGW08_019547 [Elysia chlorotica]|uniref:Endonuclease/exonuclease/phosphatase domain-containing protein n=1 Tax=Elysia chlorotica TaxID=188477 RepID=A0A433SU45_ELYCH|nr:hypothetical protein EGW08_019547 [Elysia chlorotica]
MGDLNAKVGSNNTNYERAMGREGCGSINDNGERLLETCTTYNYVIGGTLFQHQDIHKLTWCSPNGRDINQIDHLMINGTWRRSLLDVRVMRGADVGSDHHLVMATLRLKLRRCGPRPSGQRRFDVDKLKDNKTRSSFVLQVKNRFLTLSNLEQQQEPQGMEEVNRKWDHVHSAYLLASESCLGTKQRKRKEWISAETWETIEDRKDLKRKVMETKSERLKEQYREKYREADKTVKRKTRADKRAFIDDLASQAEEAAGRGEQGKVYKITKIVAGKYRGTSNAPITDKQGRLLTTESEQEARWTEHFRESPAVRSRLAIWSSGRPPKRRMAFDVCCMYHALKTHSIVNIINVMS